MTTRRKSTRKRAGGEDLEQRVKESANRIWLAGLGAWAMAEQEGGKLFKSLIAKGESLEIAGREQLGKVRERVGELADNARERFGEATDGVRGRAGGVVDRVERGIDERIGAALEKVGVPTKGEIARLTHRIEALTELVEKQAKTRKAPTRASSKKGSTRRVKPTSSSR
jgi:poly(hydroxyalkanoate) granule-associated protein